MAALYLESSAVLSWLLGEKQGEQVRLAVDNAEPITTATLTLVEASRALVRAEVQGLITQANCRALRGLLARESARWALLELTESVRARASEPFPIEPVRSLDAIHLATALEAHELFPDLEVLSFDQRILDNLLPMGLSSPQSGQ
jgi:predicted nucleic acid-binding protein